MAKKQRLRVPDAIHVNGQTIHVSPRSDLSPSVIKEMVEHQAALRERLGDEGPGFVPRNKALAAAFRVKGLIQ